MRYSIRSRSGPLLAAMAKKDQLGLILHVSEEVNDADGWDFSHGGGLEERFGRCYTTRARAI